MGFSLRKIIKQTGRDFVNYFDVPKNVKRAAKEFRSLHRLLRGKDDSRSRSFVSTSSSARHSVGNTGFHRAYPSLGVRGSYGK